MYIIGDFAKVTKEFSFCYGHILPKHSGKCKNLHGHNAKLEVTISGYVNTETGMVIDFGDLKQIVNNIIENIDHSFIINDFTPQWILDGLVKDGLKTFNLESKQSTAENLAIYIAKEIKSVFKDSSVIVKLWETPTSYAIYEIN